LADVILAPQVVVFVATPEWSAHGRNSSHIRQWLDRNECAPKMRATTWERVAGDGEAA